MKWNIRCILILPSMINYLNRKKLSYNLSLSITDCYNGTRRASDLHNFFLFFYFYKVGVIRDRPLHNYPWRYIILVSPSAKLLINAKEQGRNVVSKKYLCLKIGSRNIGESSKKAQASDWTNCVVVSVSIAFLSDNSQREVPSIIRVDIATYLRRQICSLYRFDSVQLAHLTNQSIQVFFSLINLIWMKHDEITITDDPCIHI